MWTHENRPQYDRQGLRRPSDQMDAEWALTKPFIAMGKYATPAWEARLRSISRHGSLCSNDGLPVAAVAEGFSLALNISRLVRAPALLWRARSPALCTLPAGARTRRQGAEPDDGDRGQPERQERRKKRRRVDASGYDAAKKVKGKKRHRRS